MKPWVRYLVTTIAGLALGICGAVAAVKSRSLGSNDSIGPWTTGCTYRVSGGAMPTRWWSLTLYGADDFLVPNAANIFSVASPAIADPNAWTITVAPDRATGHWLPTGGAATFDLTLRNYLPADGGGGNPSRAVLPRIERTGCAS